MLVEIFMLFQIFVVGLFLLAFFTKQEILWAVTALMSTFIMFSSYNVEVRTFDYNITTSAYVPIITNYSYPYLMGINIVFFGLSLVLGFFDIFDKYNTKKNEE